MNSAVHPPVAERNSNLLLAALPPQDLAQMLPQLDEVRVEAGQVLCEAGDLISVPANTRHWFDMSAEPYFVAIRLFNNPQGWVATFTGDPVAEQFPRYERKAA